jgi:hypothetical protein
MKRSTHWLVADYGIRPAGKPDRCFYCDSPLGQEHNEGCVIRSRTVVVRFQVDLVVDVPEDSDAESIEFKYNDGSWCADNLAQMMTETVNRMDKVNTCLCNFVKAEYLREATAEDEVDHNLFVNKLPS